MFINNNNNTINNNVDADVLAMEHEHGLYADSFIHVWSPSAKDPLWNTRYTIQSYSYYIIECYCNVYIDNLEYAMHGLIMLVLFL